MAKDLDGIEKNISKFKEDWKKLKEGIPEHLERWKKTPWDVHAYVNLFTEAYKIAPYTFAHIDSVLFPFLVIYFILTLVL